MHARLGARLAATATLALTATLSPPTAQARVHDLEPASVSTQGELGEGSSSGASLLSEDGRYVVFTYSSHHLEPDTPGSGAADQVYVRDRVAGTTELLTVGPDGLPAGGWAADLTPDGRHVLVRTFAALTAEDDDSAGDLYVLDRADGSWALASTVDGWPADLVVGPFASLSDDGTRVAFAGAADQARPTADRRDYYDVYVRDLSAGRTIPVSVTRAGRYAGGRLPQISGDGRVVAYDTASDRLVRRDRNRHRDVLVHDLGSGRTELASVSSRGRRADRGSKDPRVSVDGRLVFFTSKARTLVAGDRNRAADVFRHDRRTGRTVRVTLTRRDREVAAGGVLRTVSRSGRYLAFGTTSPIGGQRQGRRSPDVYVRDLRRGSTRYLVRQADYTPWTLTDSKRIAFTTQDALAAGDTNHAPDVYVGRFD